MDYCGPRGIPHSSFLQWNEADQDKAIAWMLDQSSRCPGCGTYPSDYLDDDGLPVDPPPGYANSVRCLACKRIKELREEVPEEESAGLYFYISKEAPKSEEGFEDEDGTPGSD